MKLPTTSIMLFLSLQTLLYSQTVNVTSPGDNGIGSLRQAITDVNEGGDASNTIHLQVPGNSPIMVNSDLPVIKKNTDIVSTGQQTINGGGQHRLFATIMADLTLTNCNLDKGAAIGGNVALNNFGGNIATSNFGSGGGGLGAGGGIYIDRGQTLILQATTISQCKAQGGKGGFSGLMRNRGGGGASFSIRNRNVTYDSGGGVEVGGDFPGSSESGGASDGSSFLTGYGGGPGGGNGGSGGGDRTGEGSVQGGGKGGYCGGGGGQLDTTNGGGGNGGGNPGGGGFGSGGYGAGGGGFGGGGGSIGYSQKGFGGGGGFGAGGGGGDENEMNQGKGGHYAGNASEKRGGGGAGIGGAIFVGDTATCIIKDNVSISGNRVLGGEAGGGNAEPGQGYAPDIFLFREAKVIFDNQQPLAAPYSIMADQEAPSGHLDNGVVKQGPGQLTLSNTNNNYRGGTSIEGGTLSVTDPKALGSSTASITLNGGTLQPTESMTLSQPIVASGTGGIDTPGNTTLTTTGNVSGSGTINKSGTCTWKQTGTSTHTGYLNVNQGTLQVDGTFPSNINIKNGAILQGTGTAGGNVTNSGTVKPSSDQLGTLTIGGNYTQNPDGLLQLQMKPDNQSEHFNVGGTADIQGTVDFDLEPGIYPKNQNYNLINADRGLTFNPNQISSNSRFPAELQITPNNLNVTFIQPQIILPIQSDQLPNNQKNLANYLFCDNFPFENDNLVNLLQNLFQLSVPNYIKALATLTPEHYGAIPIGETKCLQYLLTQNLPACKPNCPITTKTITILPLHIRNQLNKPHPSHPNYTQNTGGIRFQHISDHSTSFQTEAALSYLHTHTCWSDRRGNSDSNGLYLDAGLGYTKNNFHFAIKILGAYSHLSTVHKIFINYPIKTVATPHLWDLAEALTFSYNQDWGCITVSPRITLLQTNIFFSSILENKPKSLNLITDSKTFSYLDTLVTLRIQTQKSHYYCCLKPYLDLGYRNITHLSNREFTSKLDNYTACQCHFKTETYKGDSNTFFMEWGIAFSYKNDMDILFNYRTEAGKEEFIQAVNLGAAWRF